MISHRPAMSIDRNFIAKSWIASYRDSNTAGMISVDDWHAVMFPQVQKVLARPEVKAIVAYETTDPDHTTNAYGFIVADPTDDPPLVYYVFTKTAYRKAGIARGLFEAMGVRPDRRFNYVCTTPFVGQLKELGHIQFSQFTPLLGRYRKSERKAERPLRRRWF